MPIIGLHEVLQAAQRCGTVQRRITRHRADQRRVLLSRVMIIEILMAQGQSKNRLFEQA